VGVTSWWNTDYPYRREITFGTSHESLKNGYTAEVEMDTRPAHTNVEKTDGNDIRIVRQTSSTHSEIHRVLAPGSSWNNAASKIRFRTPYVGPNQARNDSERVYVYYGNSNPPTALEYPWGVYFLRADEMEIGSASDRWSTNTYATVSYVTTEHKYGSRALKFWDTSSSNQGYMHWTASWGTPEQNYKVDFWIKRGNIAAHTFNIYNFNESKWAAIIYFDNNKNILYYNEYTDQYVDTGYNWSANVWEHYVLEINIFTEDIKLIKNGVTLATDINKDSVGVTSNIRFYWYGNTVNTCVYYLDNIFWYYFAGNPPEEALGAEETWTYKDFAQTLHIKALGHSDLGQELSIRAMGFDDFSNTMLLRKLGYDDLPIELKIRRGAYVTLDGQLLLRTSEASNILNELLLRQETSKDLNNQLLLKMYGTNFSQKLLMRQELYSTLLNELQIGGEKLNLEAILTTLERDTFTDNFDNETYIDTLTDLVVENGKVRLKKHSE